MPPEELACRSRQEFSKLLERFNLRNEDGPRCRLDAQTNDQELRQIRSLLEAGHNELAAPQLQQRFLRLAPARFFAGASETALQEMSSAAASHKQEIIAAANAVEAGDFYILGYGRLNFGSPIDWHLDAVSGQRAPRQHWSRIDPLSTASVGDSKVVWELNRHQWLLELGQAYRLTGEEHYAATALQLLEDWMQDNPPGIGINWSSSLEVAMRLMAWCWALFLFRDAKALSAERFMNLLAWLQAHATFVERYLSHYFSPNTHLTGEALGLYYAGTLLQELEGASRWRETGSRILVEQMPRQVHADGVYFELSTRYQYYTVDIYTHYLILAQRNGEAVDPRVPQLLEKLVDFLLWMRWPDGSMPNVGDADGGWLMPFLRRAPDDYRALFSTAAVLFHNSNFAWAAGSLALETEWLLGRSAQRSWLMLPPSAPAAVQVRSFDEGGFVVMRNGWHRSANQLIFDTGPLGCHVSGGHGHADLLSIQCCAFGEPFLVDAGTYSYADPVWRNHFRSTHAHNTVVVDGHGQAKPRGPFSWYSRPVSRDAKTSNKLALCLAEASHEAYGNLHDPIKHRRRVAFVDGAYWLVIDDLYGEAVHSLDLRWQCAAASIDARSDEWLRIYGSDSALLLKVMSTAALERTIEHGEIDPPSGWLSPDYGQRISAPLLRYQVTAPLPLRLVTLLLPVPDPWAAPPTVTAVMEGGQLVGVAIGADFSQLIRIGDDDVSVHAFD